MADKQRLNSVDRFRKRSDRLVLEQYSHCEVPAGCGGVVLRWRNPRTVRPAVVQIHTLGEPQVFINGVATDGSLMDVVPGRNVLGLVLPKRKAGTALFLFVLRSPDGSPSTVTGPALRETPFTIVSAADMTWRHALDEPAADWATPAYDDTTWTPLAAAPDPPRTGESWRWYQADRCLEAGAAWLGLPPTSAKGKDRVWIRKVFDVPEPQFSS